jgi:hypothetical protein
MSVVTISREYGSGGREVARKTAELLGYHLVDKAVMGKILASYGLIDFEAGYKEESTVWSSLDTSLKTMMGMLERIDFAVARHGHAVILGRGSYAARRQTRRTQCSVVRAFRLARLKGYARTSYQRPIESGNRRPRRRQAQVIVRVLSLWNTVELDRANRPCHGYEQDRP